MIQVRALTKSIDTGRRRVDILKGIDLEIPQGQFAAIMGPSGSGKSTLLGMVAGLSSPNEGSVRVSGRVAALLELGSGFHGDLTGEENVWLNAALMGLSRKRTRQVFDEIVAFSGIEEFIQEPLRTYSTGMIMRLAFSVAVQCDPEILLVDEVLVVGDQAFQAKCFDRIYQLRSEGKTLLCVSHANNIVLKLCDRALWLDHGELIMEGRPASVLDAYSNRAAAAV